MAYMAKPKNNKIDKATERLIKAARDARKRAYAPYSKFKVGAALECTDGSVFTGCNVENATFGATCCAERTAVFKAISEGKHKFKRIAIVADTKGPCMPCGICRQVLFEFSPEISVISANLRGKFTIAPLSELLPKPFNEIISPRSKRQE